MLATLSRYFDEDEFNDNPIKYQPKVYYFNFAFDTSVAYDLDIKRNKVISRDSWVSNFFFVRTYEYYEDVLG
jgi:hypothetical protein